MGAQQPPVNGQEQRFSTDLPLWKNLPEQTRLKEQRSSVGFGVHPPWGGGGRRNPLCDFLYLFRVCSTKKALLSMGERGES